MTTRMLLVDDHRLFREGVKLMVAGDPGLAVVGEAATVDEALALLGRIEPDLLVLDMTLPGPSGLSLVRELKRRRSRSYAVVVSMHGEADQVAAALIGGAIGYVLKSDSPETLLAALRAASRGEHYLSPQIDAAEVRRLVAAGGRAGVSGPLGGLTVREREVFDLIVRNYSTPRIARALHISGKTVETHREHLFQKLGVHTVCELVRFAARHHLLEWEQADGARVPD